MNTLLNKINFLLSLLNKPGTKKCDNEYKSNGKLNINELHILNHKKQLKPSYNSVNIKFIGHNRNSKLYLNSHTNKLHNKKDNI